MAKNRNDEFIPLLDIDTIQKIIELEEVIVKPKKEKYSKKNNPAVDFINLLRKESKKHNPENEKYYSYDKYEKTIIGLNNFTYSEDENKKKLKKTSFLKNYIDTSSWTGASILDLLIKEKASTVIKSSEPEIDKEIIIGYRSAGIDESFSQENVKIVLEDVAREINIFDKDIYVLQNKFVSPLSSIGPDYYKYYLTDTVFIGNDLCVELSFSPRNAQSMGFNGKIYVLAGDSDMFIKKVTMRTPHDINLNFLQNLYINQNFSKDSLGNRHKTYDDLCVEMQIVTGTPVFYGRKTTLYDNFYYDFKDEYKEFYKKSGNEFQITDSIGRTAEFWNEKRMMPLSYAENNLINFTKDMRKVPIFYWGEKFISLLARGYITTGNPSKIDFGPLNTFLSFNDVEGVRLRFGGMTMAALNPHLFFKLYGAYGTKDRKWKYGAQLEYSFKKKKLHSYEWPRHGFYASYSYDLDLIGQHYLFTSQDNIFLSLKRKKSNLVTYRHLAQGGYVFESSANFSVEAGLKFQIQEATPWLPFIFPDKNKITRYREGFLNITLRWAKGEKFVQGRTTRLPVNMDPWIIQLSHDFGPKGFLGSFFTMNRTELSIQKRFWLSSFGYIDIIMKGGKIWNPVYYPELMWPNANLSYTIQPESYSLMNPMEFALDSYGSLDMTYFGNGILFNRIPLINRLKLREAVTFKAMVGELSKKNNPIYNESLLEFPKDSGTSELTSKPYMEIGVGLDNIFSILRVDYVWRLTYRSAPGIDKSGVRVSLHFTL